MTAFAGFQNVTLTFLREVGANNDKAWFDAHRSDYEVAFVEPAKAFVAAVGKPLAKIAPNVRAEPRINGSIFRISRDIRFSKDKRPYKDHLDLWFWEGERRGAVSGFFFRLTSDRLILGAGAHMLDKERLSAFRQAVVDEEAGGALAKTVRKVEVAGAPVQGQHYAKPPRGFEVASERQASLLRHNALWSSVEEHHPEELTSADGVCSWY